MVKALFDTNILLDYLKGVPEARQEITLYRDVLISVVTRMEVLVGTDPPAERTVRSFLDRFSTVPLDDEVSERAIELRKKHRVKLVDAIIWASAQVQGCVFITRDIKDFPHADPGIRVPYKL